MKAGIYKRCDTGKHVYVSGAGYIRAVELTDVHPIEDKKVKVRSRFNGAEIDFKDGQVDVKADRVADAHAPFVNDAALAYYLQSVNPKNRLGYGHKTEKAQQAARNDQVSAEWKDGREDKPFSKQVVCGFGPGFLSEQGAAAERWLLTETAKLQELVDKGILRHTAHDEWEVVDAEAYADFLNGALASPERMNRAGQAMRKYNLQNGTSAAFQRTAMQALGYRRCHKQSARKHRRAGHSVIAAGDGSFWWMRPAV